MRSVQKISLLVLVASLGAAPAVAQPAPQATGAAAVDDVRKADELFHEANRLVKAKQWAEAEVKFQAAWALNPTYDVALNLGQTQYRLGKSRDAAEHLAFAVRNWPLVGKREPREVAEQRVNELRQVLTVLTIRVNEPGATILVDGRMVGRAPLDLEVFVDPGSRTIEAKLAGHEDAKQIVTASKGAALAVMLKLTVPGAVASAAPTVAPTASASAVLPPVPSGSTTPIVPVGAGGPSKPVLITGGVVTGLAVVAGVVFTVLANGKATDAQTQLSSLVQSNGSAACTGTQVPTGCSELHNMDHAKDTFANAALWSFVGGGAVGAATLIFAIAAAPAGPPKAGVRVAPIVTAQGGGVMVGGSW